jgi:proteasome accessory factor B
MGEEQGFVPDKDDPAERLLALTLVLLSSPYGLTIEELYRSIRGYRLAIEKGDNPKTVEKKFDRDKKDLREAGIEVKVETIDGQQRYLIPRNSYVWPKGTSLSATQLTLMNLAAQVWATASLSDQAKHAITKLKALGTGGDSADLIGYAPRIRTHQPSFIPLSAAIRDASVVTFNYRKPGESAVEKRTISPWLLKSEEGEWLVLGWDHDREEARNFMLKRISSSIAAVKETDEPGYRESTETELQTAADALASLVESQVAELEILPDSEPWFRYDMHLPGNGENGRIRVHYMDLHLLAEDIRDYGSAVKVISPPALADAVREGFEKVVSAHA